MTNPMTAPSQAGAAARRGRLAIALQEPFTTIARLRANKAVASDAESFRTRTKQVLSLAEGFDRFADSRHVKIMRNLPGATSKQEIPLDMKAMLDGKAPDYSLQAEDILFVPMSGRRAATVRGLEAAIGMGTSIGTGLAVYRR